MMVYMLVIVVQDIKTHLAECHQEEIHYPCPDCCLVFDTFMQLRTHCLVDHMGVRRQQYPCSACNKNFSSITGLRVHVDTIHEKAQVSAGRGERLGRHADTDIVAFLFIHSLKLI